MTPNVATWRGWLIGTACLLAATGVLAFHFRRVQKPPTPSAAKLPASARILLQPSRKDSFDLAVGVQGEVGYRVGMQAGATLVYAWSTGNREKLFCEFAGRETGGASEAHSAFIAQSSGWYRWRWKNQSGHPVIVHLKLSGYYEPETLPDAGMPYDR